MRKKIIIIVAIIVLCGTAAVSFYFYRLNISRKVLIDTYFETLEESLNNGDTASFRNSLKKVIASKILLPDAKHLLNLVFTFGEQSDDFNLLERTAKRYVDRYPKDSEVYALYVYALIRNGKSKTALQVIESSDFKDEFKSLQEEAQLLHGNGLESSDYLKFTQLAKQTGNFGFYADAALIAIADSHPESAYTFVKNLPEKYSKRKNLLFHAAFESGRYEEALNLLDTYDFGFSIEDIQMLRSELLINTYDYQNAKETLVRLINNNPNYSLYAYINLAWLGKKLNDPDVKSVLDKGIEPFGAEYLFAESYVSFNVYFGFTDHAADFIKKYGTGYPVLKLMFLTLNGAVEPDRLIAGMQELLLQNPEDSHIGRYYCMFLFKTGNQSLLADYLDHIEEKRELSDWEKFYKGLLLGREEEYTESIALLKEVYQTEKSWEVLYDLGILYKIKKDYLKSIEMFQNCERDDVTDKEKSMIRTSLAEVLAISGNKKRAVKELNYALGLDNTNIRAVLLLNKLESE